MATDIRISPLLVKLVTAFVAVLLMSNVLASAGMLQVGPWSVDAGTLLFPIVYILSDVFSQVYGYRWSRRVTGWAVLANLLLSVMIWVALALPQPEWFDASSFQTALGGSWRIVLASAAAFYVGDWVNDIIFERIRMAQGHDVGVHKGFGVRAIGSSLGGSVVDTSIFVSIAFIGVIPYGELLGMVLANVLIKTTYEIVVLPLTTKAVRVVQKHEDRHVSSLQADLA